MMIFFFLISFVFSNTLIMIGGGTRPLSALKAMVASLPNEDATLAILPWGTEIPEELCEIMTKEFQAAGAHHINCILSNDLDLYAKVSKADGLYFPGGDQNKIMTVIKTYNLQALIQKKFRENLVVGGTSAGTAIQSLLMLTGKDSEVAEGLGLFKECIVDQHFLVRQRQERLKSAIKREKKCGLGIDESTAVIKNKNELLVVGQTEVWFYPKNKTKPIIIKTNQRFTLQDHHLR
jgi:cyanophycinase